MKNLNFDRKSRLLLKIELLSKNLYLQVLSISNFRRNLLKYSISAQNDDFWAKDQKRKF